MRAVIVASGPSARGFSPPDDVTVIAVNGTISWLSRADYWFSLDASPANQRWLKVALRRGVQCHVAGDKWRSVWPAMSYAKLWERVEAPPMDAHTMGMLYPAPEWWLGRLQGVLGICKEPGRIHTGNSAWGALGLAWHLGFRDVALLGVDARGEPRLEGGTPGNLSHLPLLFASALPDMRVVSCGALDSIPQLDFKEWYENR